MSSHPFKRVMFGFIPFVLTIAFFIFMSPTAHAKDTAAKPTTASNVDGRINSIRSVLKQLLGALAEAKKSNDIQRVNCLQVKLNLVKGLLKASEKANVVFLEASFSKDLATAEAYGKKVDMYGTSADDVAKSINECSS